MTSNQGIKRPLEELVCDALCRTNWVGHVVTEGPDFDELAKVLIVCNPHPQESPRCRERASFRKGNNNKYYIIQVLEGGGRDLRSRQGPTDIG